MRPATAGFRTLVFGRRWDAQRRAVDPVMSVDSAHARHRAGDPYVVVISSLVLVERDGRSDTLNAWRLDAARRRCALFEYRGTGNGQMILMRAATWLYQRPEQVEFDPASLQDVTTFGSGLHPVVRRTGEQPGTGRRVLTDRDRVRGEPTFGDWADLAAFVLNRRPPPESPASVRRRPRRRGHPLSLPTGSLMIGDPVDLVDRSCLVPLGDPVGEGVVQVEEHRVGAGEPSRRCTVVVRDEPAVVWEDPLNVAGPRDVPPGELLEVATESGLLCLVDSSAVPGVYGPGGPCDGGCWPDLYAALDGAVTTEMVDPRTGANMVALRHDGGRLWIGRNSAGDIVAVQVDDELPEIDLPEC